LASVLIGVISDTHGLLRPAALDALSACQQIIHAGDIGSAAVLDALARIAPVSAIRGNNDVGGELSTLPDSLSLTIAGCGIHVLHDLNTLARFPAPPGTGVVIAGHSHKPVIEPRGEHLLVNPGSAGPRRFRLPVSVAHLHLADDGVRAELVMLAV